MLYYKRKKTKCKVLKRVLFTFALILLSIIVYCEIQLSDFLPYYIRIRAEVLSQNSVCNAAEDTIKKLGYKYGDIVKIKYNTSGTVKSIETDSVTINRIKAEVTKAAQNEISKIYENEVDIPIGAFTNINVLSNYGPSITLSFNITGSLSSEIVSEFEQSGINQTVHHIKLVITSNLMTTSLDYSGDINFSTDYEIAQSVIVGEIPSSYGNLYRAY